jgi:hypothetical protein
MDSHIFIIVLGILIVSVILGMILNASREGFQTQTQTQTQNLPLQGLNSMHPQQQKCPELMDSVLMCSPFRKCRCLRVDDLASRNGTLCHISTACYQAGAKKLDDNRVVYQGIPMCLPNQTCCMNDDITLPETSTPVFNTSPGQAVLLN